MGRAILPGRLKAEMAEVKKFLLDQPNEMAEIHRDWAEGLKQAHSDLNEGNVDDLLQQALLDVFDQVLADAGVFKNDEAGNAGWDRFLAEVK